MNRWKWLGILAVIVFALSLGFTVGVGRVLAEPPGPPDEAEGPDILPPGLALREFIHYPRQGPLGTVIEAICTDTTTNGTANCDSYGYDGIHWANPSGIKYYANPNFNAKKSPTLTKDAAIAATRASFDTWSAGNTSGRLAYAYQGTTGIKSSKLDGYNAVLWSGSYGAIAVTRVWYYTSTKEIAEFDIILGNSWAWSYTPPMVGDCGGSSDYPYCDPANSGVPNTMDVRNIITHEAGHTLMLLDIYDASDSDLTMYGYGAYGELKKDTLGKGDVRGVNAIYP